MNESFMKSFTIDIPKIKNGSIITIGGSAKKVEIIIDQHFNWLQKKMIKWCFGFGVKDYKEDK